MAKLHGSIHAGLREFIAEQKVFFVATAPLAADGHVNVSPRGVAGTFGVIDERTFAWLDGTGSGSETVAHLRENGRITVMFCAFDGPPNIVRLHGRGRVVPLGDPDYDQLAGRFSNLAGQRAVIVVDVDRVSDSCGWGVPLMEYVADRDILQIAFDKKGVEGSAEYRRVKNAVSIDGLPGFDFD